MEEQVLDVLVQNLNRMNEDQDISEDKQGVFDTLSK
jgi:hypothetical protein